MDVKVTFVIVCLCALAIASIEGNHRHKFSMHAFVWGKGLGVYCGFYMYAANIDKMYCVLHSPVYVYKNIEQV